MIHFFVQQRCSASATLISRFLGLARDSCIAAFIPSAWQDIFWAGIKIPSTFRQLFAEGSLSAAFIPLLTRIREREGESKAREVSHAVFNLLYDLCFYDRRSLYSSLRRGLSHFFWIFHPILSLFGHRSLRKPLIPTTIELGTNWRVDAGIWVTQLMFPFLLFVAVSAWAMGVLNTNGYFFIPALAPRFIQFDPDYRMCDRIFFIQSNRFYGLSQRRSLAGRFHAIRRTDPPGLENPLPPTTSHLPFSSTGRRLSLHVSA